MASAAASKNENIQIRRLPVHFRENFERQQRLYFTLEVMGKVAELHGKVFHGIVVWVARNGSESR